MNVHIANLKSSALNSTLPEEKRLRAETQLRTIAADESDPRSGDAKLALRDLPGYTAGTENGQASSSTETVQEALGDSDDLSAMFARWLASPKSHENPQVSHWIETCEKETQRSNIYRYWLPNLYQAAPALPGDGADKAAQTFAKYLPYKWLTWELFNEIQGALRPDPTKTCFEQEPIAKRVAPYIDRWRAIKRAWKSDHGPTGECLVDVLYDPATDHPEYERQPVAAK